MRITRKKNSDNSIPSADPPPLSKMLNLRKTVTCAKFQEQESVSLRSTPVRVVVFVGISGAGRSSALNMLEDLGYMIVHSPPVGMLTSLVAHMRKSALGGIGFSLDARSHGFTVESALSALKALRKDPHICLEVVFMDCETATLCRRFDTTRRRHVFAKKEDVSEGIACEKALMAPLKSAATHSYITTHFSLTDLRREIAARFAKPEQARLSISVISFGFKKGVPQEADMMFDARFLKNPYWLPELRPLTGESDLVAAHIQSDVDFVPFFDKLSDLTLSLAPRFEAEGKSYLCIAIGCTGGQHRSVFVAQMLHDCLMKAGYAVSLRHRELPKTTE